jgi:hypothetical protein
LNDEDYPDHTDNNENQEGGNAAVLPFGLFLLDYRSVELFVC